MNECKNGTHTQQHTIAGPNGVNYKIDRKNNNKKKRINRTKCAGQANTTTTATEATTTTMWKREIEKQM